MPRIIIDRLGDAKHEHLSLHEIPNETARALNDALTAARAEDDDEPTEREVERHNQAYVDRLCGG